MRPDQEIHDVEERLTRRRREIDRLAHQAGRVALRKLASPLVLAGAAALGFLAGGGIRRRPAREERRSAPVKKTGIAGLLMTGAMWFIRARFGSPVALAQFVLEKIKHGQAPSPRGDVVEIPARHSRPAQLRR